MNWNSRAGRIFQCLVGALFIVTSISKVVDFKAFATTVSWLFPFKGVPIWLVVAVAAVVVAWESFLAVWLVSTLSSRRVLWSLLVTLLLFTLVLIRIWSDPLAPNCGCMTVLELASKTNHDAGLGIVRNIALITIVAWLLRSSVVLAAPCAQDGD